MKSFIKLSLTIVFLSISSVLYSQIKNIRYLESPSIYEGKNLTSFKVIQVFDQCALARESEDTYSDSFYGKTVLILGDLFYDEQIVTMVDPMMVGIYKYETNIGTSKTVPVVKATSLLSEQEKKDRRKEEFQSRWDNIFGSTSAGSAGKIVGNSNNAKAGSNNSWSLEGRSIRGTMAPPSCKEMEEGTIVVRITVNENGDVVIAEVAPDTDITSKSLRNAAISAVKKTKFNAVPGKKNQSGTITYKFELR